MKRLLFTSALMLTCAVVFAQQDASHLSRRQLKKIKRSQVLRNEPNGTQYPHEFNVGGRLNTNGWSGYLEYEKRANALSSTLFQLEFGEIKDPKEDKTARQANYYGFGYAGHSYVYGKQNIFYQAKLGMGQRRIIGGKGNKNGVEVSAVYLGGLSLGLVKPYYLEISDSTAGGSGSSFEKYSPSTANDFLNPNNIIGGPGLGKGWSEVQMVPGLYARIGMRFDWAEFNEFVSALEVGVDAEYYSKKIAIMVENPAKQFFYGAYVSLVFGKRW